MMRGVVVAGRVTLDDATGALPAATAAPRPVSASGPSLTAQHLAVDARLARPSALEEI
jgi:hypothetical protein